MPYHFFLDFYKTFYNSLKNSLKSLDVGIILVQEGKELCFGSHFVAEIHVKKIGEVLL